MPDAPAGAAPTSRLAGLRTLWPFVQRHRPLFASWLVALGISSAATLALPLAFRRVIDQGFASGTRHAIDLAFAPLLGVALVLVMILRPQGLVPSRRRAREFEDRRHEAEEAAADV